MIRLFNVYYPVRTLGLLAGEAVLVWTSFVLGAVIQFRDDSYLVLNYEYGYFKILLMTVAVLIVSHWLDLYDPAHFSAQEELYFRLPLIPGVLALGLAVLGYLYPSSLIGQHAFPVGLILLTLALFGWRTAYAWLAQQPFLRERVYVLGTGDRAQWLVKRLRMRPDLGIEVVGWSGDIEGAVTRESISSHLSSLAHQRDLHRVIVALPDRRAMLPVSELLELRTRGVLIEEATSWLEKMSGRIEVEQLYPSWLIFAEGFRFSVIFIVVRRVFSFLAAALLMLMVLPFIPFVILAIKLDSRGPLLYKQRRVGRGGSTFYCFKFRTMRPDAEADKGATWATDDDPRITRTGKFLRTSRLDEIPQLWNVMSGDMAFVGPRPERPEFVEWLTQEIPYYPVRNVVPPGITGWAQVRYKYGNTLDDAREKLQYDLYYIKNMSLGLDMLIMFQTVKIVLLGRGAK
jgi:sugar transferase (PEP-CTERM system associated)